MWRRRESNPRNVPAVRSTDGRASPCQATAGYAGGGSASAVVSAFGLQFGPQLGGALEERTRARIAPRAFQIPLVNHDHRLLKHVVHLVIVARSHRASVRRAGLADSLAALADCCERSVRQ